MNTLDIKDFKKKHNLSTSEIADITNVSIRAVQSWEYGQRNISKSALKILREYENNIEGVSVSAPELLKTKNFRKKESFKSDFKDLSIEEKLNKIFDELSSREERLNEKIEDLENQLRLTQLINRTYLKTLAVKANINKEEIQKAKSEENDLELNNTSN